MEECINLAATGSNQVLLAVLATATIAIALAVASGKVSLRRVFLLPVLSLLLLSVGPNANIASAATPDCNEQSPGTSINSPADPENPAAPDPDSNSTAKALDDGPYLAGQDGSGGYRAQISILLNDDPGGSTFNPESVDLNPSTPDIDHYFELYDGTQLVATFQYSDGSGTVSVEVTGPLAQPISIPYTAQTTDGHTTNSANIIVVSVDEYVDNLNIALCDGSDYFTKDFNTYVGDSNLNIDPVTIDLDPSTPEIMDYEFTSVNNAKYTVDGAGAVKFDPLLNDYLGFFDSVLISFVYDGVTYTTEMTVSFGTCL